MVLEAEVRDGKLEVVVNTALGAVSLAMSPQDVAKQVLTAAQAIQEASIAAGECEEICGDLQTIAINRLPIVCELLHLGQLFPESRGVTDVNAALLRCIESVCNALHKAQTAMYSYLQCSKVERMLMASNSGGKLEKDLQEIRVQLRGRFYEVDSYMNLANLLRAKPGAEPALPTAGVVAKLQHRLAELSQVSGAGKDRVRAIAKAALARQAPQGQKIRGSPGRGDMAVSPCGSAFATVGGTAVAVWDAVTGDCTKKMYGHTAIVCAVAWSPDGSLLATGSWDNTAAVWDMAAGTRMHELRHDHWVESVAWSPCGSFLATGSVDRTATVWVMATGSRVHEPQWRHTRSVNAVAWSPDGSRLATGSHDHTAAVWDVGTGARMHELRGHSTVVVSVAWSPDGSRVATGSCDYTAVVWDAATGERMHEMRGHRDAVFSVAWSPHRSRLVTGSEDGTAVAWDVATGVHVHELLVPRGYLRCVCSVAWSPDGHRVATGSSDQTVAVWDIETGARVHVLRGHSGEVLSVVWSPDASMIASGSYDRTVIVWNAATGARMHETRWQHMERVSSVACSPDGSRVAI